MVFCLVGMQNPIIFFFLIIFFTGPRPRYENSRLGPQNSISLETQVLEMLYKLEGARVFVLQYKHVSKLNLNSFADLDYKHQYFILIFYLRHRWTGLTLRLHLQY